MIASNQKRRATVKARARTNRAASRINRRGNGTLATHCIAAGLAPKEARSVAGTLRKKAKELGITGRTARIHAGRHMRSDCRRYTPAEVARIAVIYRPRKAAYKAAAARLALAA
ncbi:hypothetical protein AAW14_06365 [Streptomyces hygroscopicus]|uniref:hypothetical protein n=1 Tax=Streptomyces hygroscopicus TaxID=1912 RepID=UPI00223EA11D|nr:hypothetical protein [Streptomyces hygroscopicus]MCW7941664.1 hypothetical protein [Streptomyces hygroscopicus]